MKTGILVTALATALVAAGCAGEELGSDYDGYERLDPGPCAPDAGPFSLEIDNQFFPLAVGDVLDLEGADDEGVTTRVRITVLDETEEVAGVTTRVVEEAEWEGGAQSEISRNYYVQAPDGTVCYYGEEVDEYDGGEVVGHGGSWRAGEADAEPGIIMPAEPRAGVAFAQESAPGVAEDMSAITATGQAVSTPAGELTGALRCFDWNPAEGLAGDVKFYAPGIGLVVDDVARLTSRE
jgi:hypothetical protein